MTLTINVKRIVMGDLLQRGDRFKLPLNIRTQLRYLTDDIDGKLHLDKTRLKYDGFGNGIVAYTERKEKDGWEMSKQSYINTAVPTKRFADVVWEVHHTTYDGGGTGHGPHDVYPDGHHVWAEATLNGSVVSFDFYQSGCFNGVDDLREVEVL